MQVYITEKPSVAKALADYFNKNGANFKKTPSSYLDSSQHGVITWAVGHLLYLNTPEQYNPELKSWNIATLPIVPTNFVFKKTVYANKKDRFKSIQQLIKDATTIIHVGDPDREGQYLVDELIEEANCTVKRMLLNALDDASIQSALETLQDNTAFKGLSKAAQLRSEIDWLLGMNLTRYFTLKARDGGYTTIMKVGRVKAPTLNLVAERYADYKNHVVTKYQVIRPLIVYEHGELELQPKPDTHFDLGMQADLKAKELTQQQVIIDTYEKKVISTPITELYSLDTLQIDCNKKLSISPKETLAIAQALYEKKLTSYPRSDCKYLPTSQFNAANGIIDSINQTKLLEIEIPHIIDTPLPYNDSKISAHHAIVPTGIIDAIDTLTDKEKAVYTLIIKKYASMFLPPYEYLEVSVDFHNQQNETFQATQKALVNYGYKRLYDPDMTDIKSPMLLNQNTIFIGEIGNTYTISQVNVVCRETKPPKLFTEGTLIKAMSSISTDDKELQSIIKEAKGIGTPATRATIIDELLAENLITHLEKSLIPTPSGLALLSVLPDRLKKADFTAQMEKRLTEIIAEPEKSRKLLEDTLTFIKIIMQDTSISMNNQDVLCPKCNTGYLHLKQFKKESKTYQYYRCNNDSCSMIFPAIKGNAHIVQCPSCHKGFMVSRMNKKTGDIFYACSNYSDTGCKKIMSEKEFLKY